MSNYSVCQAGNEQHLCPQAFPTSACSCQQSKDENAVVVSALRILESRLRIPGISLSNPADVKQYLTLRLGEQAHESFVVLFLDTKNRLIAMEELFRGTLTQTAVYPREVVKAALAKNAAAVIVAHNHPSGAKEPSQSDRVITAALKQALGLIDVRVLDHVIVAGMAQYSFAEHGDL